MSDDIAIRARGLGKKYIIGGQDENYLTFRDIIASSLKTSYNYFKKKESIESKNDFWALKDVSFEIKKGETIGIIGRNGAGKSTLLKILSRIVTPTEGEVEIHGRVGSLLEVGTGFHPELTGRENIFLSGSILGMRKREIEEKFDEIVKFSEIEKFIDTPVKRYSSGMYVRLAFAVAANLDTDILLVDEVLAVGDAAFQKKCLGKMSSVANQGRTVLFVSHNTNAILNFTKWTFWIDHGSIRMYGPSFEIVPNYLDEGHKMVTSWKTNNFNNNPIQITGLTITTKSNFFDVKSDIIIIINYIIRQPVRGAVISAIIHSSDGAPILSTEDIDLNPSLLDFRESGKYISEIKIPGNWLSSGKYYLRLHSGIVYQTIFDNIEALSFELIETGDIRIRKHKHAYLLPYLKWVSHKESEV